MVKKQLARYQLRAVFLICKNCNVPYLIKRSHHLISSYCSKKCMAHGYTERMVGKNNPNYRNARTKKCLQCGGLINSYIKTRKFCSLRCRDDNKRKPKFTIITYCRQCGKVLTGNKKYCPGHSRIIHPNGYCKVCKEPIFSIIKNRNFCSARCYQSSLAGKGNPNYKDGRKELKERIRQYSKGLHSIALKRDNYTCKRCGQIGGKLEADHITPFSMIFSVFIKNKKKLSEDELYIESKNHLPFHNINNLQTLCRKCNMKKLNRFEVQQRLV